MRTTSGHTVWGNTAIFRGTGFLKVWSVAASHIRSVRLLAEATNEVTRVRSVGGFTLDL